MNINSLYKKVELLANIAIIVLAVSLGIVLVKHYVLPDGARSAADMTLHAGGKLPLPEVDWKKNGRTLVLAVSSKCPYCAASVPFYQRLTKERGNTRLVIVMPQPAEEGQRYLSESGISADEVREARLGAVGIVGTPTLILVDETGTILKSWVGKLPEDKEAEVLSQLQASAPHPDTQ